MKYDLIKEINYNNNWYYITIDYQILKLRTTIKPPYSPIISMKKYNDTKYFTKLKLSELEDTGLVKKLREALHEVKKSVE